MPSQRKWTIVAVGICIGVLAGILYGLSEPPTTAVARVSSSKAVPSAVGKPAKVGTVADEAQLIVSSLRKVKGGVQRLMRAMPPPTPAPSEEIGDSDTHHKILQRRARKKRSELVAAYGQQRRALHLYDPSDTIFISICSFRDVQCAPTIYDLYEKAKAPENVFLGIVMQHIMAEDISCVPKQYVVGAGACKADEWCPTDNMKTRIVPPLKAKGPTFGRYYGMLMFRDERYFMMIDSHNRWVTHWDHIVVTMHKGLITDKGVLAHYPEAWINPEDPPKDGKKETNAPLDNRATTHYMCKSQWIPELGYVRMGGHIINRKAKFGKDTCRPQPYASAGFVFSLGKMIREVPFDPYLPYIFDGEEIMYAVRMWTHGWDIFSPSENILYHYYYRTGHKRVWSTLPQGWEKQRDAAIRRIQFMLGTLKQNTTIRHVPEDTQEHAVLVELDTYGVGKNRTVTEWWDYAGLSRQYYNTSRDFCSEFS